MGVDIGFIGLGRMGLNMVRRLAQGGHCVIGYSPSGRKKEAVEEAGAEYAATVDALRRCTARREPRGRTTSGLPCGAPAFVTDLEIRLARPLMPRPRGRPRQLAAKKESGSG